MALYNRIWLRWHDDVIDVVALTAEKLRVTVLLLQFQRLYKIFRQGFDWNECKYMYI